MAASICQRQNASRWMDKAPYRLTDLTGFIRSKRLENSNLDERSRDGKKELYPRACGRLPAVDLGGHGRRQEPPSRLQ